MGEVADLSAWSNRKKGELHKAYRDEIRHSLGWEPHREWVVDAWDDDNWNKLLGHLYDSEPDRFPSHLKLLNLLAQLQTNYGSLQAAPIHLMRRLDNISESDAEEHTGFFTEVKELDRQTIADGTLEVSVAVIDDITQSSNDEFNTLWVARFQRYGVTELPYVIDDNSFA